MLVLVYSLFILVDRVPLVRSGSGSSIANSIKYRMQRPDKFINDRKEKVGNYDGLDALDDESKSIGKARGHLLHHSLSDRVLFIFRRNLD